MLCRQIKLTLPAVPQVGDRKTAAHKSH